MKITCPRDRCGRSVATVDPAAGMLRVTARSRGHYIGSKPTVAKTTTELGPEIWRVVTGACRCGQYWVLSHELVADGIAARRRSLRAVPIHPTHHRRGNSRQLP